MKRLLAVRHSLKAKDNSISPEGLVLAKKQGEALCRYRIERAFHGILPRTAQTCSEFFKGYGVDGVSTLIHDTPITELGSDELFAEMVTPEWKASVASGMSNYGALIIAHPLKKIQTWTTMQEIGLRKMFDAMEVPYTETGICFGHSPCIELAAAAVMQVVDVQPPFNKISEMAGIVFEQDNHGAIRIASYIEPPK